MSDNRLMQNQMISVENIYIPAARRKLLDSDKAENIAMSIIEHGQKTPIQVRVDGQRYVFLVEVLHRLEACKLLGEEKISAILVSAKRR